MNLKFNRTLEQYLYQFNNITISNSNNDKQSIINNMYGQLTNSIKSAYSACSRTCTFKKFKRKKMVHEGVKRSERKNVILKI
jgi:hypothetical protein